MRVRAHPRSPRSPTCRARALLRVCAGSSLLQLALVGLAAGQLRPRRVGTSALGEQQEAGGGGGFESDMVEPMAAQMGAAASAFGGGGDMDLKGLMEGMGGGGDMAEMMQKMMGGMDMENNPMLKAMADSNPELAKLMSDPEAMKEQMAQVGKVMASEEGQQMAKKMMEEVQSVLTNPEKLQEGLQQLTSNPALKGLADAVPGLREVLDDPEAMQQQVAAASSLPTGCACARARACVRMGMGIL